MKQKSQETDLIRTVETLKSELSTLQSKLKQKDQQIEKHKTELKAAPNSQAVLSFHLPHLLSPCRYSRHYNNYKKLKMKEMSFK